MRNIIQLIYLKPNEMYNSTEIAYKYISNIFIVEFHILYFEIHL